MCCCRRKQRDRMISPLFDIWMNVMYGDNKIRSLDYLLNLGIPFISKVGIRVPEWSIRKLQTIVLGLSNCFSLSYRESPHPRILNLIQIALYVNSSCFCSILMGSFRKKFYISTQLFFVASPCLIVVWVA